MNEYYNSQREKTDKRGKSFEIQNKFVCSKTLGGFTIFFGKRKRKKKFRKMFSKFSTLSISTLSDRSTASFE